MSAWVDKIVVVTGGNSGLGTAISAAFLKRQATVVILSRSGQVGDLENAIPIATDVTNESEIERAIEQIIERFGKIDVWINNVGKSTRVALEKTSTEDYRSFMDVNFYSAVGCSLKALPWLKKSSGSLVQIGSLASKTGWKSIAPYVASKHALAGFAHQLRIEGPANVHYLMVMPGPIRRADSETDRYEAGGDESLDAAARKPGAGVKVKGIPPELLAEQIFNACVSRKPELVAPRKARILFALLQISPRMGDWLLKKFAK